MDLNVIFDFIIQHGLYIIFLILILICFGLGIAHISKWSKERKKILVKSKSKYLDKSIVENIEILGKIVFSIIILASIILVSSSTYKSFKEFFWDKFSIYFAPLVLMVITIIIIIILSQVIKRFFRFLRIALKKRPGEILKSETTRFIELTLVYLVYIVGLTVVLVIGLSTIGLSDPIWNSLKNFLEKNLSPIILIMIGLVIIYAISKFVAAFMTDLKKQSTRYNPNTLDITQNIVNYILLIIAILLVILSIFSFTGLSKVSETILIAIIIVVGFILAMSASGALGNFFSGLVLMFTSPFENGDTIKIGNGTMGKVKSKALFSTNILTEDDEEVKFPNSKLLDSQIVNYSNSPNMPLTINVKVNYKVSSEKVHSLLRESAEKTTGINIDSHPPKSITVKFEPLSIKYRLRVFLDNMNSREEINSELLDNIQKTFQEANVTFQG